MQLLAARRVFLDKAAMLQELRASLKARVDAQQHFFCRYSYNNFSFLYAFLHHALARLYIAQR